MKYLTISQLPEMIDQKLSRMVCWIQSSNRAVLVYTPGFPAWAHPTPHDTTPTTVNLPFTSLTTGPPESPEKESQPIAHISLT